MARPIPAANAANAANATNLTAMPQDRDWALNWCGAHLPVSRETLAQLDHYVALLLAESQRQNLIAASTLPQLWRRHIVDSLQLLTLLPDGLRTSPGLRWLDLGSGAGLPGLVCAIASEAHVTLAESRRLRCDFLRHAVAELGLAARVTVAHATIHAGPVRAGSVRAGPDQAGVDAGKGAADMPHAFHVISARAFAPLPKLLRLAAPASDENTLLLLPKGKNAVNEVAQLPESWQKLFHVKHSMTDIDAHILIARGRFAEEKRGRKR